MHRSQHNISTTLWGDIIAPHHCKECPTTMGRQSTDNALFGRGFQKEKTERSLQTCASSSWWVEWNRMAAWRIADPHFSDEVTTKEYNASNVIGKCVPFCSFACHKLFQVPSLGWAGMIQLSGLAAGRKWFGGFLWLHWLEPNTYLAFASLPH